MAGSGVTRMKMTNGRSIHHWGFGCSSTFAEYDSGDSHASSLPAVHLVCNNYFVALPQFGDLDALAAEELLPLLGRFTLS